MPQGEDNSFDGKSHLIIPSFELIATLLEYCPSHALFYQFADDMTYHDMALLYPLSIV